MSDELLPSQFNKILRRARKGEKQAKTVIVEAFLGYAFQVGHNTASGQVPPHERESAVYAGLLDAIASYRPRCGVKFSTFLAQRVRFAVLRARRTHYRADGKTGPLGKHKSRMDITSPDMLVEVSDTERHEEEPDYSRRDLLRQRRKFYVESADKWCLAFERKLRKRNKQVVLFRLEGRTMEDIASTLKISAARVQQIFLLFQEYLRTECPVELKG